MNLSYVALGIDGMSLGFDGKRPRIAFSSEFGYRTSFINNFLSRQIKKRRFRTDGSFHMVYVEATQNEPGKCAIVPDRSLQAQVRFDRERYELIKGTKDCEYYLGMLEEGFRKAAEYKEIPLQVLLDLLNEFRKGGCKNEWLHKKRQCKDLDIQVDLHCYFSTLNFELVATVRKISSKETLCSGVVLRTEPDEIHFAHKFKDIFIDKKNIAITDHLNTPSFLINIDRALAYQFDLKDFLKHSLDASAA